MLEHYGAPLELKLAEPGTGGFSGMASAWGVVDSHGDTVVRGAFAASLAQHKQRGTLPVLYVQHGPALGHDPLPGGVWTRMEETDAGLAVEGKISALDTDYGRRLRSLVQDGALRGLSIGYRVHPNGAHYPKSPKAGEARRVVKSVDLIEVSLVTEPSNPLARVSGIKTSALLDAVEEFKARYASGDAPTERELERLLRDALGLTRSDAADLVAGRGWKSLRTRDAAGSQANEAAAKAVREMRSALDGISFPTF